VRPDGVIAVSKGPKRWRAIVEAKTGASLLEATQMETYLDVAREYGFDAVISISNHYVTSSSAYLILLGNWLGVRPADGRRAAGGPRSVALLRPRIRCPSQRLPGAEHWSSGEFQRRP
jgi:hypothetical protein